MEFLVSFVVTTPIDNFGFTGSILQVGVIGNLVHSSVNIKKEVLAAGALQPVIGLLRSVIFCFKFCINLIGR